MAGKGKAAPHRRQKRKGGLPELHLDYCFLSTDGDPLAKILVAKERQTRHTLSTVVPLKGASVQFPARRVLAFLKELGLESSDIILKSDHGPAILDLLNNIASRRAAKSKVELVTPEETNPEEESSAGPGPVWRLDQYPSRRQPTAQHQTDSSRGESRA